jgi:hypothetical protein
VLQFLAAVIWHRQVFIYKYFLKEDVMFLPIFAAIWVYMALQYLIIGLVVIPTLTELLSLLYSLVNVNLTAILVLNHDRSHYMFFFY